MRIRNYRNAIILLLCCGAAYVIFAKFYNKPSDQTSYECQGADSISPHVNVYNAAIESEAEQKTIESNKCVPLRTVLSKQTPICVYDKETDKYISKDLLQSGTWEMHIVSRVLKILREDPDLVYLDLGCNIGVFTISAAMIGHQVYAVDPNKMNLRLLAKSLSLADFKADVTMFLNAVSDTHGLVTLNEDKGNVGGLHAEKVEGDISEIDDSHKAVAIMLDDLRPYMCGKKIFIKMDVEGFEYNALKGGELFFEEMDIKYVLMEWFQHVKKVSGDQIIQFMTRFHFMPHMIDKLETVLNVKDTVTWPENVLWIKT